MLSRNYDFPAGVEPVSTKEPYLMEVYPDEGYPCLFMCAYDYLGCATDGINSEGLTVALLADVETGLPIMYPEDDPGACYNYEGTYLTGRGAVGLAEVQVVRFILETCKDADEAKRALLTIMHHYQQIPLHYIVGDRHGKGFVFEGIQQGNLPRFHDCKGAPLPVTNHPLRDHEVSTHEMVQHSVDRLETLRGRLAAHKGSIDPAFIRANAESVAAVFPAGEGQYASDVPARTLWHAYYDLEERSLVINYFLHDTGEKDAPLVHRTPDLHFELQP
jgi:hypothetical protein